MHFQEANENEPFVRIITVVTLKIFMAPQQMSMTVHLS